MEYLWVLLLWSSAVQTAGKDNNSTEVVWLLEGSSRCAGMLMLNRQGEWRPVEDFHWTLKTAAFVCRDLDCGSAISLQPTEDVHLKSKWRIKNNCFESESALAECVESSSSFTQQDLTCSDSVRLVNGTGVCSGRLEVKSNPSDRRWSSVCEHDFDQQAAAVVCRELGCGAPSVLQGALYGDEEALMWTQEFHCGGHESALLACRGSGSARSTCFPGKAVGLTCSEPAMLVGGGSRCAGVLEVKHQGHWRPVADSFWTLNTAALVCRQLHCGSAVSVGRKKVPSGTAVWGIWAGCVRSGSALRECVKPWSSSYIHNLTCSDLLLQPVISVFSSTDGVSESQHEFQVSKGSSLTISCSIQPQYPGGSFQLTFTSSTTSHNFTQQAVNHSAHFLFPAAEADRQGTYSCTYHVYVFSHNFSSESPLMALTVSNPTGLIIKVVFLPLTLLLMNIVLYFYLKASRRQKPGREETTEHEYYNLSPLGQEERT